MRKLLIFSALILIALTSESQPGYNWPADKEKATECMTLLGDAVRNKQFNDAIEPLRWLLSNAPDLHKNVYLNGSKVYEDLEAREKVAARKTELQDTVLMLYDMRIKYFGEEDKVLNFKGLKAYPFLVSRMKNTDELFVLYDKIFAMNGKQTFLANTNYFMDILCKRKAEGKINDEQIIEEYEKINLVLEENINTGKNKAAAEQTKANVDNLLASCVTVDCPFVINNFGPKFRQNTKDLKLAKKIYTFMISGKCTDDPLFLEASQSILDQEPSYGGYKIHAIKLRGNKEFDKAIQYYEKAISVADDNEKKADCFMAIANIHKERGSKDAARNYARKAMAADGGKSGEAYELIGDLYFTSGSDCQGENPVQSRAVYLAAYEMYEKAGAKSKMAQAEAQFPSPEEIFTLNMSEGQTVSTGCWIGETVKIRKRK